MDGWLTRWPVGVFWSWRVWCQLEHWGCSRAARRTRCWWTWSSDAPSCWPCCDVSPPALEDPPHQPHLHHIPTITHFIVLVTNVPFIAVRVVWYGFNKDPLELVLHHFHWYQRFSSNENLKDHSDPQSFRRKTCWIYRTISIVFLFWSFDCKLNILNSGN